MAGRGRPTFQKRLKEQKRQEKRRDKLERKLERRAEKESDPTAGSGPEIDWDAADEFDAIDLNRPIPMLQSNTAKPPAPDLENQNGGSSAASEPKRPAKREG